MGIEVATELFQTAMSSLFDDFENVIMYLDDIIILGLGSFEEHMEIVNKVLHCLHWGRKVTIFPSGFSYFENMVNDNL